MYSVNKVFAVLLGSLVITITAGLLIGGIHSDMLTHSCKLYAIEARYDSAHIAQICGK